MPRQITSRRDESRVDLPSDLGAWIEFRDADDRRHRLALTQLSASGCAFHMPGPIVGIKHGAMLADVTLSAAEMEIRGNVEVCHLTRGFGSDYSCGVRFFPSSDDDRNRLIGLVSRLEALDRIRS